MKKAYVYPRFSKYDFLVLRLGGAGLGNLLFTYSRALVYSRMHEIPMIWPTWISIKAGTWIRREKDKRLYHDLFLNRNGSVGGLKKALLLLGKKRVSEKEELKEGKIMEFLGMDGMFEPILEDYALIREDLYRITRDKNKEGLTYDFSDSISVHVRLGDFMQADEKVLSAGAHNTRLPIEWYKSMILQIRKLVGRDVNVYVFSDGRQEELEPLLSLPNVSRVSFGNSIADILALSKANFFIASGSTFSMWARFLGRMGTMTYKNQLKQRLLTEDEPAMEFECEDEIPEEYHEYIKSCFNRSR